MIRFLRGNILKWEKARVVVLTNDVGYEILLPEIVWKKLQQEMPEDGIVSFYISYHQTQQQPKPVLIGFTTEVELEFFELLITVKDIGPAMASRALTLPVSVIARAIEERDVSTLLKLNGIGRRKADMIVSELNGKAGKYALMKEEHGEPQEEAADLTRQVIQVLVKQLGHNKAEAAKLVSEALKRNSDIATPEQLFEEVYRGTKNL